MPPYRVYPVTRQGRIMGPATIIECADDQEATRKAHEAWEGHHVEVWESARFIARLIHDDQLRGVRDRSQSTT